MPEDNTTPESQPDTSKNLGNSTGSQRVIQPSAAFAQEMQVQQQAPQPEPTAQPAVISSPAQQEVPQVAPQSVYPVQDTPLQQAAPMAQSMSVPPSSNHPKRKKTALIVSVSLALLVIVGVIGFVLLGHRDKTSDTPVASKSSQASETETTDLSVNPDLASVDTSSWQSYSEPTMKVSFKYPNSIPVKDSRIKLFPPKPPTSAIQSEVAVGAEILKTGDSGIVTPIFDATLFDVVTFAPGSPNDKIGDLKSDAVVYYKSKSVTVSGTTGTCEYYALKYDTTHKYFACKFNRNNLIYSVVGSWPGVEMAKQFPQTDFWTTSQKIFETFQFSN